MATKSTGRKASSNSSAFHILGDTLESAAETFEEATANASDSARRAAGVARSALANALYKSCYGVSYGLVYSSVFLVELLPTESKMREAFTKGAGAALADRRKVAERKATKAVPAAKPKRSSKAKPRAGKAVKKRAADFDVTAAAEAA